MILLIFLTSNLLAAILNAYTLTLTLFLTGKFYALPSTDITKQFLPPSVYSTHSFAPLPRILALSGIPQTTSVIELLKALYPLPLLFLLYLKCSKKYLLIKYQNFTSTYNPTHLLLFHFLPSTPPVLHHFTPVTLLEMADLLSQSPN